MDTTKYRRVRASDPHEAPNAPRYWVACILLTMVAVTASLLSYLFVKSKNISNVGILCPNQSQHPPLKNNGPTLSTVANETMKSIGVNSTQKTVSRVPRRRFTRKASSHSVTATMIYHSIAAPKRKFGRFWGIGRWFRESLPNFFKSNSNIRCMKEHSKIFCSRDMIFSHGHFFPREVPLSRVYFVDCFTREELAIRHEEVATKNDLGEINEYCCVLSLSIDLPPPPRLKFENKACYSDKEFQSLKTQQ